MRHQEAGRHLAALVAGELEEPLRSTVQGHAVDCPTCRNWRETHREVREAMAAGADGSDHPSSTELAGWALEPESPNATGLAHVECCASCREELELARGAILEARVATGLEAPAAGQDGAQRRGRLALAAACVGVVVVGGLLVRSASSPSAAFHIANETLAGHQLITAEKSIHADAVEIAPGGDVVFEAGDIIALGDGFVVATGATFAAATSISQNPRSNGI